MNAIFCYISFSINVVNSKNSALHSSYKYFERVAMKFKRYMHLIVTENNKSKFMSCITFSSIFSNSKVAF